MSDDLRREEATLELVNQLKRRVLLNHFLVEDEPFPILTAMDIMEKENHSKCSYWYVLEIIKNQLKE